MSLPPTPQLHSPSSSALPSTAVLEPQARNSDSHSTYGLRETLLLQQLFILHLRPMSAMLMNTCQSCKVSRKAQIKTAPIPLILSVFYTLELI